MVTATGNAKERRFGQRGQIVRVFAYQSFGREIPDDDAERLCTLLRRIPGLVILVAGHHVRPATPTPSPDFDN